MTLDQLRQRREEIVQLARQYGAHDVRVFGSVARGDARPDSDLDILVRFERGRSLFDQAGFELDLETLLGCAVDIVSEGGISPHLKDRIHAEAVPL